MSRISLFALTASSLLAATALTGCAHGGDDLADVEVVDTSDAAVVTPRTVFVHLFEWKWTDIAQECEQFLGPKASPASRSRPLTSTRSSGATRGISAISRQLQAREPRRYARRVHRHGEAL